MERNEARDQWDSAAAGWAKWEPLFTRMLGEATGAMLDAARIGAGDRVLDIACGSGDQAFAAAQRVGPAGHVLATDISPRMIELVQERSRLLELGNVHAAVESADELGSVADDSFDAAICRLGLMLMPSPAAVVRRVGGVLKPGGRFAALVFASPAANPSFREPLAILRRFAAVEETTAGGPGLFALSDADALHALFSDNGFADVELSTVDAQLQFNSASDALHMLQEAAGVYRALAARLDAATRQQAWDEVSKALGQFEGDAGFRAPTRFHVISGEAR